MMDSGLNVVCAHCGQVNRVARDRPAAKANCGRCAKALFDGHPAAVDDEGLTKQIERSDIPLVVDFWAEWCGPCRAMAPAFADVAQRLEPNVRFLKVNVDDNPRWAGKLGIRGIPAVFVFRGGQAVANQAGAMDATTLQRWVNAAVATA